MHVILGLRVSSTRLLTCSYSYSPLLFDSSHAIICLLMLRLSLLLLFLSPHPLLPFSPPLSLLYLFFFFFHSSSSPPLPLPLSSSPFLLSFSLPLSFLSSSVCRSASRSRCLRRTTLSTALTSTAACPQASTPAPPPASATRPPTTAPTASWVGYHLPVTAMPAPLWSQSTVTPVLIVALYGSSRAKHL